MNRQIAILTATIGLLAFTGCSTIRQIEQLTPEGNESPSPTTVYVIDIGTPLAPEAATIEDQCPTGQDCTPSGQPVPTTVVSTAVGEPSCAEGGVSGECPTPSGSVLPTTIPNTTPATVCGGNITGECD